jgi:hypothetical protein
MVKIEMIAQMKFGNNLINILQKINYRQLLLPRNCVQCQTKRHYITKAVHCYEILKQSILYTGHYSRPGVTLQLSTKFQHFLTLFSLHFFVAYSSSTLFIPKLLNSQHTGRCLSHCTLGSFGILHNLSTQH